MAEQRDFSPARVDVHDDSKLALLGGRRSISKDDTVFSWPPLAGPDELTELAAQRQTDIRISGNAGPVGEFEKRFAEFISGDDLYSVAFNSGTSALYAAYYSIGLRPGDEIIGPNLTYHAALSPARMLGVNVALADIDRDTRCIDLAHAESLITDKTKAITVVHQWGHPADMDAALEICSKYGLRLIEDCSHAHGSFYRGRACGTFGDVSVFSLQANKAIFAGEGGILLTRHRDLFERAVLVGHYRDRSRSDIRENPLRSYWVTGAGMKLRMSPFNAIVALHSLAAFPRLKVERHKCLNYLNQRLADVRFIEPVAIKDYADMGAWYGFKPLYVSEKASGVTRESLVAALRAEGLDISAPSGERLSEQPLYGKDDALVALASPGTQRDTGLKPVSDLVSESALSLPTFSNWEEDKRTIDHYIDGFLKVQDNMHALLDWQRSSREVLGSSKVAL